MCAQKLNANAKELQLGESSCEAITVYSADGTTAHTLKVSSEPSNTISANIKDKCENQPKTVGQAAIVPLSRAVETINHLWLFRTCWFRTRSGRCSTDFGRVAIRNKHFDCKLHHQNAGSGEIRSQEKQCRLVARVFRQIGWNPMKRRAAKSGIESTNGSTENKSWKKTTGAFWIHFSNYQQKNPVAASRWSTLDSELT